MSTYPEVWFAIPSANPENCRRTLPAWRERGYKVAVLQNKVKADIPADVVVWADAYPGWPGSINELCARVVPRHAPIVVSGGDDMLPDPEHTAGELASEFARRFPDGFGVMQPTGDGFLGARHFCGSPWFGRGWIDRAYGGRGPMFPGYRHNWADNELYWVARGLGALWERPDLSQRHEHFTRRGEATPAYWKQEVEARDRADVQTFIARAWTKFPGHEPVDDGSSGTARGFDAAMFEREYAGVAERHWLTRYALATLASGPEAAVRDALAACAKEGLTRVGVFGAGSHTKAAAAALMSPPVDVVCIIDESPLLRGTWMWNWPIVGVHEASRMGLDAVVISANSMHADLVRRAAPLAAAGVRVLVAGGATTAASGEDDRIILSERAAGAAA